MTTLYLVLEISALLLVIVLPLRGPRKTKNKKATPIELSEWAIDENGDLQSYVKAEPDHHHVK
ncbi:MAG TPA: hypothetical protein VK671_03410 [Mucilaginibacter sp.]|jgi:hypothetical protein|nr:hypothetical protein [Mucilaginibacter sp.]